MIIIGILVSLAGIIALCWLLFNLAVFALPLLAGISIGLWANSTGAGGLGGVIVGALAAAATFGLFQVLLLVARPAWLKLVVLFVFVAPAVGITALMRLTTMAQPGPAGQGIARAS